MVGDSDGVVVVPYEEAEGLLPKLRNMVEKEVQVLEQIRNKTIDRSWVDKELQNKGYYVLDAELLQELRILSWAICKYGAVRVGDDDV